MAVSNTIAIQIVAIHLGQRLLVGELSISIPVAIPQITRMAIQNRIMFGPLMNKLLKCTNHKLSCSLCGLLTKSYVGV